MSQLLDPLGTSRRSDSNQSPRLHLLCSGQFLQDRELGESTLNMYMDGSGTKMFVRHRGLMPPLPSPARCYSKEPPSVLYESTEALRFLS